MREVPLLSHTGGETEARRVYRNPESGSKFFCVFKEVGNLMFREEDAYKVVRGRLKKQVPGCLTAHVTISTVRVFGCVIYHIVL